LSYWTGRRLAQLTLSIDSGFISALSKEPALEHKLSRFGARPVCNSNRQEDIKVIVKNSSKYPSDQVEDLVKFALKNVPHSEELEVHVKNSKHAFYGRIFASAEDYTCGCNSRRFLIVVRIGKAKHFPYLSVYPDHKRCQKYAVMLNDWKEALVKVTAHEGMHLRQWIDKKPMWEHQAEKHAVMILDKYRDTVLACAPLLTLTD
jgi:hypothetical protein